MTLVSAYFLTDAQHRSLSTAWVAKRSDAKPQNFHAYRPLLSSYPQLAASSLDLLPQHEERKQTLDVDWTLVSSIMLTSRLQEDPAASICRSEAAGGSCANPGCEDVHILRSEPTGVFKLSGFRLLLCH